MNTESRIEIHKSSPIIYFEGDELKKIYGNQSYNSKVFVIRENGNQKIVLDIQFGDSSAQSSIKLLIANANISDDRGVQDNKFLGLRLSHIKFYKKYSYGNGTRFYFNDSATPLWDSFHSYQPFKWANRDNTTQIYSANNDSPKKIKFGELDIGLHLEFRQQNEKRDNSIIKIKKIPWVVIHSENSEEIVLNSISVLANVFSFVMAEKIDYLEGSIDIEGKTLEIYKDSGLQIQSMQHGAFVSVFKKRKVVLLDLLSDVNVSFLLNHAQEFNGMINKYIFASNTDGESCFMFLFNVIDQIRLTVIDSLDITTDFKFKSDKDSKTISRDKSLKKIRGKIRELSIDIVDDQQDQFSRSVPGNASFILKKNVIDQFNDLFESFNISEEEYKLSFKEIKKIRDSIFHGGRYTGTFEGLQSINLKLNLLTEDLIIKFMSFENTNTRE
jgi:hypothetical protein